MSVKTIAVTQCDGCGADLTKLPRDTYKMSLKGGSWGECHNEQCQSVIDLDFCADCAQNIKGSLAKIAGRE